MQKAVELTVKGKTLRGMYHCPDLKGKYSTIILFHGFGGDKLASHRMFLKLSRMLEGQGVSTVRFDFLGSGESDGDFEEMTFSTEVFEAEQILKYVWELQTTDVEKIGVVGLSMGGAIASILAGRYPSLVKALVLWSAASIETMASIYRDKEDDDSFLRNARGDMDIGGLWLNHNFYTDLIGWNTYDALRDYQGPALILQGTADQIVPPATAERYQAALVGRGNLVYVEEADHTYNHHRWEEKVLAETTAFLKQELL